MGNIYLAEEDKAVALRGQLVSRQANSDTLQMLRHCARMPSPALPGRMPIPFRVNP